MRQMLKKGRTESLVEEGEEKETDAKNEPKLSIDAKLVCGAAIFGIGWGLSGICPAPAIAMMSVPINAILFLPSCFIGMKASEFMK